MGFARRLAERVVLPAFRRVGILRDTAAFIHDSIGPNGYGSLKQRFIDNGARSRWNAAIRSDIAARFEHIHAQVEIHSNKADGLIMAEALLSMETEGGMIECGCFAGGSTAKLSILAKLLGKNLLVFDSFEGLPAADSSEAVDYHSRYNRVFRWRPADCSAALDRVSDNVSRFGEISSCTFVPGWFADTLTPKNLPPQVSFAYTDVARASSTRDAFVALWPLMADGSIYFSRDVGFTKVLQALLDQELWRDLNDFPPVLFGAGYGMGDVAPNLGYMVKGRSTSAEYIHSLMIDKPR